MTDAPTARPAAVPTTRADLVTTALLGLRRGGPPVDGSTLPGAVGRAAARVPHAPGAAGLLDVVAIDVVARRAGTAPVRVDDPRPAPADVDADRVPPAAARARLATLLAASDATSQELVVLWLRTAAARGYVAPPALLPDLLTWALRPAAQPHRELVRELLGARGRWLAGRRPEWARVAARATASRRDLVQEARTAMDDAQWAKSPAATRLADVTTLAGAVRPDDEARLARCLRDRAATVREAAAQALLRIEGSAFAAECTRRALACVRVERRMLRKVLVVDLPPEDAAAPFEHVRAGAGGRRARLLRALVAATPPQAWVQHLGLDASTLVRLDVSDSLGPELHAGWRTATARSADPAWARALVTVHPDATELLGALRGTDLADTVAALLPARAAPDRAHVERALLLAATLDAPWPGAFVETLLRDLTVGTPLHEWELRNYLPVLAMGLPHDPGTEQRLRAAADRPTHGGTARSLRSLADTLRTRRDILEELA